MRKLITLEHLQQCYPKETWTYIFTNGSAEDATCNGGAGVYVKYPDGTDDRLSFATGLYSTNYKAETEALRAATSHIEYSPLLSHRVVFLSDALSVLQALQTGKDTDLNNLVSNLTRLCMKHTVIVQWIPSHCGIHGNESADTLAKEGTTYAQNDRSTTYSEVKRIMKAKQQNLFKQNHPDSNGNDPYHLLNRQEQVSIFRLRTGHNRLRNHLFHKLKVGDTDQCRCRMGSLTTEHFLLFCPKPRVATKADLARPNTHEPETLRQPGGPETHCYLCSEVWRDHLTNEEEDEEETHKCTFTTFYFTFSYSSSNSLQFDIYFVRVIFQTHKVMCS